MLRWRLFDINLNKKEYFRQDSKGNYSSISGCGNDLKTEIQYIRKLIIESVKFWMTEKMVVI